MVKRSAIRHHAGDWCRTGNESPHCVGQCRDRPTCAATARAKSCNPCSCACPHDEAPSPDLERAQDEVGPPVAFGAAPAGAARGRRIFI